MNLAPAQVNPPSKRTPPRMLELVRIEQPHPEIKRVIFSGADLVGFPPTKNGAHIKLFFPQPHQKEPRLPELGPKGPLWPEASERPITRTFSVRFYDPPRNEIAVDFAWHNGHEHHGPASQWLRQAKKGQRIGLAGPGGPDPLIHPAAHHIFIGDTSALGALWALTELPSQPQATVFLVANHPASFGCGVQKVNLYRPKDYPKLQHAYGDLIFDLQDQLQAMGLSHSSDLAAFVAGENSLVLGARDFLKQEYRLTKKRLYAVPYWHIDQNEEAYHQRRHDIMDEVY